MLSIAQPVQENIIFNTTPENRRIITSKASDVGPSSGKEQLRLQLSRDRDPINKFTIALLKDQDSTTPENDKWVYLYSTKGPVKAIISSIVRRLLIPETEVRTLAATVSDTCIEFNPLNTALEDKIQAIIENYERKVGIVKCFLHALQTESLHDNIEGLAIKFVFSDLESIRDDSDFDAIVKAAEMCFFNKDFSNMKKREILQLIDRFIAELSEMDENFLLDVPVYKEKITDCTDWKDYPFLMGNYFNEDPIVGLNLVDNYPEHYGPRYVTEIDGYCYRNKPKMNDRHVPYTKDGKIWVLLNIQPLSRYLGIDIKELKKASKEDENQFSQLIDKQITTLNKGILHHKFKDSPVLTLDLSQEIYKYLNMSDLNVLSRLNRQYKPDIDLAMLTTARKIGYEGCDIVEALKYLKQDFMDRDEEMNILCKFKIYPRDRIVYDSWVFGTYFPKKTFLNFKNLNSNELLELFGNEKLYPPFFMKISGEFIKKRGKEALLVASRFGAADVITKLLENGVDVNTRNSKGNSSLHFAAYYGKDEAIKVLLDNHADVNSLNELGESPIFLAYNYNNKNLYDIINLLQSNGADLYIKRKDGMRFIDFLSTKPGYETLSGST